MNIVVGCWLWKPIYCTCSWDSLGFMWTFKTPHLLLCVSYCSRRGHSIIHIALTIVQSCLLVVDHIWTLSHLISTWDCQRGVLLCLFVVDRYRGHSFIQIALTIVTSCMFVVDRTLDTHTPDQYVGLWKRSPFLSVCG